MSPGEPAVAVAPPDDEPMPAHLPRRIGWLPFSHAAERPEAEALIEGTAAWSYARLAEAIRRAAALLVDLGVRPGDRIMIVAENGIAEVVLVFAASEIDAWPVPVNARLTPVEIDRIRDHGRPRRTFYTVAS
ncbi:MAG: AMP-binding protein, partial [Alphaproteobacteria bacterium]